MKCFIDSLNVDESCLTNGYLDKVIDWIPGMKDIRLGDLPTFIQTTNHDDVMFNFCMEATDEVDKASAVVFLTFDALEQDVMDALSSIMIPPLYTVCPIQLLLNQIPEDSLSPIGRGGPTKVQGGAAAPPLAGKTIVGA
ncbi:7-deoxyloganetin glucosyltransferase-like isoform X1 [Prunus yedoensis var. nudiflora]|uniref:7-deoxyloganetin glucosyltransferase-like isoform X1 n=1 Tax=Prunus yedoensis var. nudiflora TaxID=2094558 RepID=A0A314ZII8_PRUYE|nr:7-deoxyloganetin glucosyltransferase-like isoform X1 [Prunus yedoensis var. nudiflora]